MARYKYLGEKPRPDLIKVPGVTSLLRIPKSDGTVTEFKPLNGTHFIAGQDMGYDISDALHLVVLNSDPRFEKI